MEIFRAFWKFSEHFVGFQSIVEGFRAFMRILDHFDGLQSILGVSEYFGEIQSILEDFNVF